ncbi:hypothetical protein S83_000777 [Arachis hypogaea]
MSLLLSHHYYHQQHYYSSKSLFIFLHLLASTGLWVSATTFTFQNKCELRVDGGDACNSACRAFGKAEYCCDGEFGSPAACKPSVYSEIFKSACPKAYSYAFDDATSTFTCSGADYTITFCPTSLPSLKSLMDSGAGSSVEQAAVATKSWIANLATGASTRTQHFAPFISAFFVALTFIILSNLIS